VWSVELKASTLQGGVKKIIPSDIFSYSLQWCQQSWTPMDFNWTSKDDTAQIKTKLERSSSISTLNYMCISRPCGLRKNVTARFAFFVPFPNVYFIRKTLLQ
jgi:hypothetical protein